MLLLTKQQLHSCLSLFISCSDAISFGYLNMARTHPPPTPPQTKTGEYKSQSLEISNLSDMPAQAFADVVSKVNSVLLPNG